MYGGLVMEGGPAAAFTGAAQGVGVTQGAGAVYHPYTKALLAASPRFGSHYVQTRLLSIPGKVTDPANPETGCPFAPRCAEAGTECTQGIPPLVQTEDRVIRCVIHGVSQKADA
jgi:peptide/nickel transport system permease protein